MARPKGRTRVDVVVPNTDGPVFCDAHREQWKTARQAAKCHRNPRDAEVRMGPFAHQASLHGAIREDSLCVGPFVVMSNTHGYMAFTKADAKYQIFAAYFADPKALTTIMHTLWAQLED